MGVMGHHLAAAAAPLLLDPGHLQLAFPPAMALQALPALAGGMPQTLAAFGLAPPAHAVAPAWAAGTAPPALAAATAAAAAPARGDDDFTMLEEVQLVLEQARVGPAAIGQLERSWWGMEPGGAQQRSIHRAVMQAGALGNTPGLHSPVARLLGRLGPVA